MPILDTSSSSTQPTKATSTTTSAPSQNMPGLYVNKSHHHQSNNLVKTHLKCSCVNMPFMPRYKNKSRINTPPPESSVICESFVFKSESYVWNHESVAFLRESFAKTCVSYAFIRENYALTPESFAFIRKSAAFVRKSSTFILDEFIYLIYEN